MLWRVLFCHHFVFSCCEGLRKPSDLLAKAEPHGPVVSLEWIEGNRGGGLKKLDVAIVIADQS
jgi:hypothetical protein